MPVAKLAEMNWPTHFKNWLKIAESEFKINREWNLRLAANKSKHSHLNSLKVNIVSTPNSGSTHIDNQGNS